MTNRSIWIKSRLLARYYTPIQSKANSSKTNQNKLPMNSNQVVLQTQWLGNARATYHAYGCTKASAQEAAKPAAPALCCCGSTSTCCSKAARKAAKSSEKAVAKKAVKKLL
jgi:hypothetical protein